MQFPLHPTFQESVSIEGRSGSFPISFQRVSDRESPSLDFSTPRIICRTGRESLLTTGMVINRQGRRFLLADHSVTPDYKSFWAFEATRQVLWQQLVTTTNPLTNLPKSSALSAGTNIWVAWEIMTRQPYEREIGVQNELTRVLTSENVQVNHVINGQQVKRVNVALGLRIAEVS